MPSAISFIGAALPCLLLGAAHAATATIPAAAPDAPVPATHYQSSAAYRALPAAGATPDQAWKEQNRIVAATDSMALTMAGHGQAHAGHGGGADPHAGHGQAAAHAGHAGHQATSSGDPHAAHKAAPAADPHAGHTPAQHAAHMAAQAGAKAPAAPAADPHAAHRAAPAAPRPGQPAHDHAAHTGHGTAPAGKPAAGHQHEGHH